MEIEHEDKEENDGDEDEGPEETISFYAKIVNVNIRKFVFLSAFLAESNC